MIVAAAKPRMTPERLDTLSLKVGDSGVIRELITEIRALQAELAQLRAARA